MQCFISEVLFNRSVPFLGMKRVLLIFIAWVILEKVNAILDLVIIMIINGIVADIVSKIIRFVLPFM